MAPRLINLRDSLDVVWEEAVYTEARLTNAPHAAALAPRMGEFIARIEAVRTGQYSVWRAEVVAQAGIDAADEVLDTVVIDTGKVLDRAVDGDHNDARWLRYAGKSTPKKIAAQALEKEMKTVGTWPDSLKTEPEKSLRAQAPVLESAIAQGAAAVDGRDTAVRQRRDFAARDRAKLVEDFNALRLDMYADLTKQVGAHGLDRAWPEGFFRKTASGKSAGNVAADPPGNGVAPAPATTTAPTR